MKKIGMMGIGRMGHGIAMNLQRHGYALALFDHPGNQPLDELLAGGAELHTDAQTLAATSDVVILVLTGSAQVEEVLTGPQGLIQGLRPGSVVMDCSTSLPSSTVRMAQAVQAAGSHFLDVPMTRTPKEAAEGRLNLLVGGDMALLETCMPVLRCFAENVTHAGPIGAGHSVKLLHNFVSLGMVALLSEAAACARHHGVTPQAFVDILSQGGAGGVALERVRPYLTTGDIGPLKFTVTNARKDLSYYNTMAQEAQAFRVLADAVLGTLDGVAQAGNGQAMVPQLVDLLKA